MGARGFLAELGSVDFAGGDVVHISSGITALVLAIILEEEKVMRERHTEYIIFHLLY